jgi:hypothetical protein
MGGSPVAGTDTKLGWGSCFFPLLVLFSAFLVSFPFARAETGAAFEPARVTGGSSSSLARNDCSCLLTSPSSKEENAPGSPASAGAAIAMEPVLFVVGDDDETCKTVATFTPCLTQLEHHLACPVLHTLTLLTSMQNWHKSRCDTFLPRTIRPTASSSADLA